MAWLWLIVALPLTSALVLAVLGSRFSRKIVAALGVGSIGVSSLIAMHAAIEFASAPPPGRAYTQVLWTWIPLSMV